MLEHALHGFVPADPENWGYPRQAPSELNAIRRLLDWVGAMEISQRMEARDARLRLEEERARLEKEEVAS